MLLFISSYTLMLYYSGVGTYLSTMPQIFPSKNQTKCWLHIRQALRRYWSLYKGIKCAAAYTSRVLENAATFQSNVNISHMVPVSNIFLHFTTMFLLICNLHDKRLAVEEARTTMLMRARYLSVTITFIWTVSPKRLCNLIQCPWIIFYLLTL